MTYFRSHRFHMTHKVSGGISGKRAFNSGLKCISSKSFLPTYKRYIQSVLELFGFVNNFLEHIRDNVANIQG